MLNNCLTNSYYIMNRIFKQIFFADLENRFIWQFREIHGSKSEKGDIYYSQSSSFCYLICVCVPRYFSFRIPATCLNTIFNIKLPYFKRLIHGIGFIHFFVNIALCKIRKYFRNVFFFLIRFLPFLLSSFFYFFFLIIIKLILNLILNTHFILSLVR